MLADLLTHIYASSIKVRRLYASVLLMIALILVSGIIWLTVSAISLNYDALQERRVYLGNLLMMVEAGKAAVNIEKRPASEADEIFFEGKSREVIGAKLQSWLTVSAEDAGAELSSVENNPNRDDETQSYIGLAANLSGTWKSIQAVIVGIETARPLLFVRQIEIHSVSDGNDRVEPQVSVHIGFRGLARISAEQP